MKRHALAAALLVTAVAAAQTGHQGHSSASPSMTELERLSGRDFDAAYLTQMIAHHEAAVTMAMNAFARGTREDVRAAAKKVVDDQTREVGEIRALLKNRYNAAPLKRQLELMDAEMQPMLEQARKDARATNADRAFLKNMIPHHQSAIEMSEMALEKAARAEVKTLAQNVIRAQRQEINQYNAWLKKGY